MRPGELLALAYFVVFVVAALALGRRRALWRRSLAWAVAGVLVAATARSAPLVWVLDLAVDLRDWWLLAALPLAYWAPAPLVGAPHLGLERRQLEHLVALEVVARRPRRLEPGERRRPAQVVDREQHPPAVERRPVERDDQRRVERDGGPRHPVVPPSERQRPGRGQGEHPEAGRDVEQGAGHSA